MRNQIINKSYERIQKAYDTVIRCHDIILSAETEEEINQNICNVLVEEGPYKLAWIGSIDNSPEKRVIPVAESGFKTGYLSGLEISWGDNSRGQGPTGKAIRSRKICRVNNILNDTDYLPWRKTAVEYGYRSSIAIPIYFEEKVIGTLNIYSDMENGFSLEEENLFQRLSKNITQGIYILRLKSEREAAQQSHYKVLLKTIDAFVMAMEKRDPYTAGHQKRVRDLSVVIAKKMGLDSARIEGICLGALIHDIGKIYVPGEVLNRPGKITNPEFDLIKLHSQIGQEIISEIDFPWEIEKMVLQHHERLDGSGYPYGIKGDEIIIEARIIAISDVVEAISSHRPYRPALGIQAALEEIKNGRGKFFDAEIVDFCVELFESGEFQWDSKNSFM